MAMVWVIVDEAGKPLKDGPRRVAASIERAYAVEVDEVGRVARSYDPDQWFEGLTEARAALGLCTCGSGAHPRHCALHPGRFAEHVAEINADWDEWYPDEDES